MSSLARTAVAVLAFTAFPSFPALGAEARAREAPPASPSAGQERCEHGVRQALCARCDPKLAAVYRAKRDWCAEHERPESQCVLCHPELAKKGIK